MQCTGLKSNVYGMYQLALGAGEGLLWSSACLRSGAAREAVQQAALDVQHQRNAFLQQRILREARRRLLHQQNVWLKAGNAVHRLT